jgi:hypothetical protein
MPPEVRLRAALKTLLRAFGVHEGAQHGAPLVEVN